MNIPTLEHGFAKIYPCLDGKDLCGCSRGLCAKFCAIYCMVLPQTIHFLCDWQQRVNKELLRSCVHLNLRLLSFNVPECCPLQAYCNVETPSLLIFAPFVPARLGMTRRRKANISHVTVHIRVVSAKARVVRQIPHACTVFSPGC